MNYENRNIIESTTTTYCTKKDLQELINKNFPDSEVDTFGQIASIQTTEMTDGTIMQSIVFGKVLDFGGENHELF